ncbi:MAG: hypothetical protein AABY32_02915 [Nanoarchaeota archaeon]
MKIINQVKDALYNGLLSAGIESKIKSEKIKNLNLYRIIVMAPKFKKLDYSERQHLVWRIADRILTDDNYLLVCSIFTLTEEEEKE